MAMKELPPSPKLSERYLLAAYSTGGVIVDLSSGNYFRLNASATRVCQALRDCEQPETDVARAFGVPVGEAVKIVSTVMASLTQPAHRTEPQGSYHFLPQGEGYVLTHDGATVLRVSPDGNHIAVPARDRALPTSRLRLYVRALAPKILFRLGVMVLHASACLAHESLVAFSGLSGAGKTTTARAFASSGCSIIAEDLLVVRPGERPVVVTSAERAINQWAEETANRLTRDGWVQDAREGLSSATGGPELPLRCLLLLDEKRRRGARIETQALSEPDALLAVMSHLFLGAREPQEWSRFFDDARLITATTPVFEATVPNGVTALEREAERYISTIAS